MLVTRLKTISSKKWKWSLIIRSHKIIYKSNSIRELNININKGLKIIIK